MLASSYLIDFAFYNGIGYCILDSAIDDFFFHALGV